MSACRSCPATIRDSQALATRIVERARTIGYAPSLAAALVALGRANWLLSDGEAARAALTEALDLAERHGLDTLAADSASLLTKLAALVLREQALGHEWARQAGGKLARIDGDAWRRAELLSNRGLIAHELAADHEQARALHEQALALREELQAGGDEARIWIAESHQNLGNVVSALGDVRGGIAHYRESRRILVDLLGPDHPRVAEMLYAEAAELMHHGELDEALAGCSEALDIVQRQPDDAVLLARVHHLLSEIRTRRGQSDEALTHARRALEILTTTGMADPAEVAEMHDHLGVALRDREDHAAALAAFDAGLGLLASSPAPSAEVRLALLFNRGGLYTDMRRFSAARADFAAVDDILRAHETSFAGYRPYLLTGLRRSHLLEGHPALAEPALAEALAILPIDGDAALRAEIEFLLARSLPTRDRARARTLAHSAGEYYRRVQNPALAAEVDLWLTEHSYDPSLRPRTGAPRMPRTPRIIARPSSSPSPRPPTATTLT
ncbi:tetratricopeptide repeat protein [Nannocystis sp.]|uniref:tetratricopeptide repeat protein n=1 Tax=Nannocystis sp. TaxID=1962667 RepID=UPI0025DEE04E|nr:tetratricopeptide repeat protein [Nannocystis sp.]MBK7829752.1 tetratricopeptide repeat protein [Nannocystis sp.]